MKGTLLYGTSSWSEKSWEGVFYPAGTAAGDYLGFYATKFKTVEADVTYYRVPSRAMVEGWAAKTPEDFVLAAKFPRSIVHGGDQATPNPEKVLVRDAVADDLDRFLDAMSRLGPKCGPLVLQFPYFNRSVFSSPKPFLDRLDAFLAALPKTFRYAVEIRNGAWIKPAFLDLLRKHDAAFVWVDLSYLPHPAELAGKLEIVTTDFVYARLIGDRKAIDALTTTFDRIVVDQSARLARWAALLKDALGLVPRAYVYANNHYAGHGPATIQDLAHRVLGDGSSA